MTYELFAVLFFFRKVLHTIKSTNPSLAELQYNVNVEGVLEEAVKANHMFMLQ